MSHYNCYIFVDPDMSGDPGKCFVVYCGGKPTFYKNRDVYSAASLANSLEVNILMFESSKSPRSYKICFETAHSNGHTRCFSCERSSKVIWLHLKVPFIITKQTWHQGMLYIISHWIWKWWSIMNSHYVDTSLLTSINQFIYLFVELFICLFVRLFVDSFCNLRVFNLITNLKKKWKHVTFWCGVLVFSAIITKLTIHCTKPFQNRLKTVYFLPLDFVWYSWKGLAITFCISYGLILFLVLFFSSQFIFFFKPVHFLYKLSQALGVLGPNTSYNNNKDGWNLQQILAGQVDRV